jgi:hypothetical protein
MPLPAISIGGGSGLTLPSSASSGLTTSSILIFVVSDVGDGDGDQNLICVTLLALAGAVSIAGGPSILSSVGVTNLTIGSGVRDKTFTLSSDIPSNSIVGTLAVAGTVSITLTVNLGLPACSTGGTSADADTHTTKKHLKLPMPLIRSLATLVYLGKHNAHKLVDAQLMQHGNNN